MNSNASDNVQITSDPGILLSDMVVTPLELGKIQRELFALDDFLVASSRTSGRMPHTSTELQSMAKAAKLNLLLPGDRAKLIKQFQFVRRTAPTVQISFASDPSKQALRALVRWFRENGHPNTLIAVGIQPNIAGGCVVRTATKTFDFSLQKLFSEARPTLVSALGQNSAPAQ